MQYNRLGNSGLLVSELSFGSWITFDSSSSSPGTVGGSSRQHAAKSCFDIMKAAYLGGVNLFDNAEAYAAGDAERLMGDAVRMGIEQKVWTRADLVLTTKIMFGAMPKFDCQVISYYILSKIGRQRVSYVVCKLLRF